MSGPVETRRMVLLRRPPERILAALRDELPAVARFMDGVASVRRLERAAEPDGAVRTVHQWTAGAGLPAALQRHVDEDALVWIERSRWHPGRLAAEWSVESRLLGESLTARGATEITPAMAGQGARVTFTVATALAPGGLGPLSRGPIQRGLREATAVVVAKTLQDLAAAVDIYLGAVAEEPPPGVDGPSLPPSGAPGA